MFEPNNKSRVVYDEVFFFQVFAFLIFSKSASASLAPSEPNVASLSSPRT